MNIAELFVSLGVKGSDKTVGAISNVKKGLGETASMSLEAKAGIIAAMYALERLFAVSGAAGTGMTNFNAATGVTVKTLQQYQYAARQMGVSNQETEATFRTLQSTMTKTLMGQGAPKGLARVATITGDLSPKDIEAFAKSPELLIQRLQQYAQKETNEGLRAETLKSFGVGEGMIAAMARGGFNQQALNKAPTYSDKEIGALDRANIAWSNLGNKIQMAVGRFNAMHGGQFVTDISKITDEVLKMVGALTKLAERLKVFELIGKAFEGWGLILSGINSALEPAPETGVGSQPPKERTNAEKFKEILFGGGPVKAQKLSPQENADFAIAQAKFLTMLGLTGHGPSKTAPLPANMGPKSIAAPRMPALAGKPSASEVTVHQTMNFQHEGKDVKKLADSTKKMNQETLRQMPQGQFK